MFKFFKRAQSDPDPDPHPQAPIATPNSEIPAAPTVAEPPQAAVAEAAPSPTTSAPQTEPTLAPQAPLPTPIPFTQAAPLPPAPPAPEPPPFPPQRKKGLLYSLFSPETRLGRFMRPLLRWLAAITGLFALGLLAGYLLLYQPTQRDLDAALSSLDQAKQSSALQNKSQQAAVTDRNQAQQALQTAQASLTKATSANKLLVALVDISNARVALVNKDGATAKTAIEQAQTDLAAVLPFLQSQDKTRADVLQTRLDLVAKELISDPQATLSDLDKLAADLTDLHKKLFAQ
jgi:hypothetical protein